MLCFCLTNCNLELILNENKLKQISTEESKTRIETPINDNQIIQQKELIIEDLNNKYQQITQTLDKNNKKHEEEIT